VDTAEIERQEGCAEPVVIDGPTPPRLRRTIRAREADRCANPRCHHRADHCHHIVFRSRGGKTELSNEVAICATCHALIHAGLLRVTRASDGTLEWAPVGSNDGPVHVARGEADRLPVLHLDRSPITILESESAFADSAPAASKVNPDELAQGLCRLGFPVLQAKQIIEGAMRDLRNDELTEAMILRRALAGRAAPGRMTVDQRAG
jgi:hypothetical protein